MTNLSPFGVRHMAAAVLAAVLMLAACTPKSRSVDYPLIDQANTPTLDISRVELTDSVTTVYMNAFAEPHTWIRIAAGSYLQADGQQYVLTGAEGIDPDSLFWMPDSGKANFVLYFEPMPVGTKVCDFLESESEESFKLFGIDLTGKKTYGEPEGLPAEVRSPALPDSMPVPILESGETTVRLHMLCWRPGCSGDKATLYVNSMLGKQDSHEADIDPETGMATFTFMQDGTANAFVVQDYYGFCNVMLAPGETVDVYADARAGRMFFNREMRATQEEAAKRTPFHRGYANGTYAGINHYMNTVEDQPYYGMNLFTGEFADYHMTSAQYAAHVTGRYKALADSIAQSNLSGLAKDVMMIKLRQNACIAMAQGNYLRVHNYRHVHDQWDRSVAVDGIEPLKPEDAQQVGKLFDITDPKLLMGEDLNFYHAIFSPEVDWADWDNMPDGVVKCMHQAGGLIDKASNGQLTPDDLAMLKAQSIPFFHNVLSRIQQEAQKQMAQLATQICKTPDVANEKVFDAIIAPHKGKVVLVDLWNTWCGPCRAAIKHNEPLKDGELKNDNLVWIYIANETSPINDYAKMTPEIKGLHYRLNSAQWSYLTSTLFNIDGIPSYVVVDKQGHATLRNDLRDHDLLKKTLLEELAK